MRIPLRGQFPPNLLGTRPPIIPALEDRGDEGIERTLVWLFGCRRGRHLEIAIHQGTADVEPSRDGGDIDPFVCERMDLLIHLNPALHPLSLPCCFWH